MKTKEKAARVDTAGRPAWIRGLKAAGVSKDEAWKQNVEKYHWGSAKAKDYFGKVWDSEARAEAKKVERLTAEPAQKANAKPSPIALPLRLRKGAK